MTPTATGQTSRSAGGQHTRTGVAVAAAVLVPAGEPVRDILSANPGSLAAAATVGHLAFKGGSAPGAATYSWYAEPAAGDPLVVVVQVADETAFDPLRCSAPPRTSSSC